VNEQVSKGAIALYLSRRHGIPAWEVGSSMLFIMFCEYYYLLGWATVGVLLEWDRFPRMFHAIPWIALGSAAVVVVVHLFFTGRFGAATPGPMHSVAIVLWVVLFPERPGEMTTFGFVQHNFFVLFNAAVGLLFLRRATRELFATVA